jgi:hypothetical protein
MNLKGYIDKGLIVEQPTSKKEISDLLAIVERDYNDSGKDITTDWQFGIAYNAALKLATVLIRASGYRVKGLGHHRITIQLIPEILGKEKQNDCDYLDSCRRRRNIVEYDGVGGVTETDVLELREFVLEFKKEVQEWIKINHNWIKGKL